MPIRPFLLRLLLLAVFFTGSVGTPLHEAAHLRQLADVIQQAAAAQHPEDGDETPAQEADAPCAWCLATSIAALATPPQTDAKAPLAARSLPGTQFETAFIASSTRWRFASRDPPASS